jgi:tetratricopeptide (TPR) repeat protein
VRYVLEGDVTRDAAGNAVNLRVIDALAGAQVWSERAVLQASDVAVDSSPAVRGLTTRLRNAMSGIEGRRVLATPTAQLTARELVLRAFETGGMDGSREGLTAALKLIDDALRLEPDLVPALVLRAAVINNLTDVDPQLDRVQSTREQDELTARAVRLDAEDPSAWNWRSMALTYLDRWDAALEANAAAIKLDPYESRWRTFRAQLFVQTGRPAEALMVIDELLALNPQSSGGVAGTACGAHMMMGDFEKAIAMCERSSGFANGWYANLMLAAAYANRGDMDKAAAAKANVLRVVPALTIAELRAKDPSSAQAKALAEKYLYAGLRKVGFPEN